MEISSGKGKFIFSEEFSERIKSMSEVELDALVARLGCFIRKIESQLLKEEEADE